MRTKTFTLLAGLTLLWSLAASAQGPSTTCGGRGNLFADGRLSTLTSIPVSTSFFWDVAFVQGHSYSVELYTELQVFSGGVLQLFVLAPGNTCPDGPTTLTLSSTIGIAPAGAGGDPQRVSFVAPVTSNGFPGYVVEVKNTSAATAQNFRVAVTDTTLFNPRWSTFSSFITQYGFRNTTNTAISVTLTVTDTLGSPPVAAVTQTFTVPAAGEVFKIIGPSGDIVIPGQHGGFANLATQGPPGSIKADAYFINPNGSVIVPSSFDPVNAQH